MDFTSEDISLYRILLDASVNGICFQKPDGIEQTDIDRFIRLNWCGIAQNGEIVLAYNDLAFSELDANKTNKPHKKRHAPKRERTSINKLRSNSGTTGG